MTTHITETELVVTAESSGAGRGPGGAAAGPQLRRRPRTPRAVAGSIVWHVFCFVLLAVLLYPVAWLLGSSFKPGTEILVNPSPIPWEATLANFEIAFQGVGGLSLWQLFVNSMTISVLSVVGNVMSCVLAAYAFARLQFRFRGALFAFMISTIMLPMHVVLIPQFIIFNQLGMVGTFWPLVLPKFLATEAFFVFLMIQFIRGIPRDLDEAARIDGAGPFRTFWSIILPLMRPAVITTMIFSFIWSWDDFFPQLIYLNKPESFTLQLGLRLFVDQTSASAFGPMFAMSVLAILPVVLFFAVFQRYLVDGMATSGMKG